MERWLRRRRARRAIALKSEGYRMAQAALPRLKDRGVPNAPPAVGLACKPTTQADMESDWFAHWCHALKAAPLWHRKLWEYAYVLQALHEAAAALPHVDVTKPDKVIGTNTVGCMQSGVFWGYVGLINGICERIRAEHGRAMTVIATGGLAPLFQQGDAAFDVLETDLTMHGLTVIHAYNTESEKEG